MPDHQTPPPLTTRLKEDLPLSTDGLTGEGCGRSTEENLHMLAMIVGGTISTAQTDREFASLDRQAINDRLNHLVDIVHCVIKTMGSSLKNSPHQSYPASIVHSPGPFQEINHLNVQHAQLLNTSSELQNKFQTTRPNGLPFLDPPVQTPPIENPIITPKPCTNHVTCRPNVTEEVLKLNVQLEQLLETTSKLKDDLQTARDTIRELTVRNKLLERESKQLDTTQTRDKLVIQQLTKSEASFKLANQGLLNLSVRLINSNQPDSPDNKQPNCLFSKDQHTRSKVKFRDTTGNHLLAYKLIAQRSATISSSDQFSCFHRHRLAHCYSKNMTSSGFGTLDRRSRSSSTNFTSSSTASNQSSSDTSKRLPPTRRKNFTTCHSKLGACSSSVKSDLHWWPSTTKSLLPINFNPNSSIASSNQSSSSGPHTPSTPPMTYPPGLNIYSHQSEHESFPLLPSQAKNYANHLGATRPLPNLSPCLFTATPQADLPPFLYYFPFPSLVSPVLCHPFLSPVYRGGDCESPRYAHSSQSGSASIT
ncbi:hypothetical protein PSTT_07259 [Puccinia striiformis]|uniref:Uncharacterized protein n=1 Tax=Puccinia striiformis TaxID=27350 RepID=A0A2S4VH37_9BASI|nr:hypothetical protein PSTT_07259 [Puccinia striiformis]